MLKMNMKNILSLFKNKLFLILFVIGVLILLSLVVYYKFFYICCAVPPTTKKCEEGGGKLEYIGASDSKTGVCIFTNGAKCEEWAYYRGECSPSNPNFCISDEDCACGTNVSTGDCFVGSKEFVNIAKQCPDFCTGIAGHLETKCVNHQCKLVNKLQ
ncbi:MAG: DUF333 domain-containing protein [Candidatus Diapherotrites archaeon]|nr:DUF333 domain-containing protein [Candidatus Diapherotrites archaeon]